MKARICLAALLVACAHSPEPTLFALSAKNGKVASSAGGLKVELRRTALPRYLDRPHIVRRATAEQLQLDGNERWGAPLDEMVAATLAENLAQRLPGSLVYTDSGAISAMPDLRVEVQLFRFERMASGDVELLAEVAVHSAGGVTSTQRFAVTKRPAGVRTSEVVATMSELLGQLADAISAVLLRQAPPPAR